MDALARTTDALARKLFRASATGHFNDARRFITEGAKVNAPDVDGDRALHYAARYGRDGTVIALIALGAKVDVKNRLGRTPLFLAAENGHTSAVRALLERGASVNMPDKQGLLPLDRVIALGDAEMAEILKTAMQQEEKQLTDLPDAELSKRRQSVEKVASLLDAELLRRRNKAERSR
jgi:hypothetical protein